MTRHYHASSVLTLLVLFILVSFLHLSTPNPLSTLRETNNLHRDTLYAFPESGSSEQRQEQRQTIPKEQNEEEDELFKGVDPKTLAAVLLEALNHSYPLQGRDEEEEHDGEEELKAERGEVETYSERTTRDRDGWQELEMLIASQGKERGIEEEEERKKALEDEERMTEKVTSHTTSHTIQIQTEQQPASSDGKAGNGAATQQGSSSPEQNSNEEEEQLNSEELKSLETVMKEFPRLNTKRGDDAEQKQRESRAFSSYNEITPIQKGSDLALSKKKLKWQEETQKALYFPTFAEDNSIYEPMVSKATQSTSSAEQGGIIDDSSEEEKEEEVLSPEEEEAQAKVEQEEIMRQAEEAQKAKIEEEKLADIASDMLLRYMVKQNGNKKYSPSLSNAAEDKRSNEEQEVTEEDDIDPQTIDKLIEISSKLHLPADDVVDIITDVEKKKKKDMQSETSSTWHSRPSPLSSSFRSGWQVSNDQNSFSFSKKPSPAVNILKTWFQEKNLPKSGSLQRKLSKPFLAYHRVWPEKFMPFKQDRLLKPHKYLWRVYPYPQYTYASNYQRRPFSDYYPFYFTSLPRTKPYYYRTRPSLTFNSFPENTVDDTLTFPPKRRYHSWIQPQLRKPPTHLQQKYYFKNYQPQTHPQMFQPAPIAQARTPPQTGVIHFQPNQFYTSTVTKNKDYPETEKQPDDNIHEDLEKFIQKVVMNRLQGMD
uniref:Neurosecretory protein VGF n=1 Tax=Austrofundulus limnaeus TaxID=52670 RepID=A0A2I4CB18_AUSLI